MLKEYHYAGSQLHSLRLE